MLGRFPALIVALTAINVADGYIYEIRKGEELKACVSLSDKPVAFVETPAEKPVDVHFVTPPVNYDCNLLVENGCDAWSWKDGWKLDSNVHHSIDRYPLVTDFRWIDLPVFNASGEFETETKIKTKEYFKLHFSILVRNSAQFLFTNDSSLEKGYTATVDSWHNYQSVLQYCTNLHKQWSRYCGRAEKTMTGQKALNEGKKWTHVKLESSERTHNYDITYETVTNTLKIDFKEQRVPVRSKENYVSFRTNGGGLFKLHNYRVLLPFKVKSHPMVLYVKEDFLNSFCLDVVFATMDANAFKLEISDEKGSLLFVENAGSTRRNKWTTERITRSDVKLKKGWFLRLTAETEDLKIGAIKFCKHGYSVYEPKTRYPTRCHALEENGKIPMQHATDHFSKTWSELGKCDMFRVDCTGLKLCYMEAQNCACFVGFHGSMCKKKCPANKFGQNCSQVSQRNCLNGNHSRVDGSCQEGCAAGFNPPDCMTKCQGNRYGANCSSISTKNCFEIDHVDGSCLGGCSGAYYPPECKEQCGSQRYGINCSNISNSQCTDGKINHVDGKCLNECKVGYYFPDCETQCKRNYYGENCSILSRKHCFEGEINLGTGKCLKGCEIGYYFPDCEKECSGKSYGKSCLQISNRYCLNGNYSGKDGTCLEGCVGGYYFPDCLKQCNGNTFGKNCSQESNRKCLYGKYSHINGSCLEGCVAGYTYPDCDRLIPTATPLIKNIGLNQVILDVNTSNGYDFIFIQYKKRLENQWTNESENFAPKNHRQYPLMNLKPNTVYAAKIALLGKEAVAHPQNFYPGEPKEFKTLCRMIDSSNIVVNETDRNFLISLAVSPSAEEELCRPLFLTVRYRETESILNKTFDEFKMKETVENCACGQVYQIVFSNASLSDKSTAIRNHTCGNCLQTSVPGIMDNKILIITTLVIMAVATTIGVWFCAKKSRNSKPKLKRLASVRYFTNPETADTRILVNDSNSDSQLEVEQYLLSALADSFLREQFEKHPLGQTQSWKCGTKPANINKNRMTNLAAYDSSRVKLDLLPGNANSDYINANYVDGYKRSKAYIASQGPTAETLNDFWRMVWRENISLIVMVANLYEGGTLKCEKYWPDDKQEEKYGCVSVRVVKEEINADYTKRDLSISRDKINRLVRHLHYTCWPAHRVPMDPRSVANFVERITQTCDNRPILVHCSAGFGRTGTVILIDACLQMVRTYGKIDVENIFSRMRSQRANLVENLEQFEFAHLVLLEKIATSSFEISCNHFAKEYSNLKEDKMRLRLSFTKLGKICERDLFLRGDTRVQSENKCRQPESISSSSKGIRLFLYENVLTMSSINAVFVDGYKREKEFIVTGVPTSNTAANFWRVIDQFYVTEILLLNELTIPDADFLPLKHSSLLFGEIRVDLVHARQESNCQILSIQLHSKGQCKMVSVKCVRGWMPGDVAPRNTELLVQLWQDLKDTKGTELVTVVCHDGVTASGLFLSVGCVLEKIRAEQKVDVGLAVRTVRKSRPAFVNFNQFEFIYDIIAHCLPNLIPM